MAKIYDPQVPEELKRTQLWFGSIIGRPIDDDHLMLPISPSGNSMEEEAPQYISPSPTLASHERIQIYNQQYWWRLLSLLHDIFPFLTNLFGYADFNRLIGFPYICHYRPEHWSLTFLGTLLPKYLKETYWEADRRLIVDAAMIDEAFNEAFFVEGMPPINMPVKAEQKAIHDLVETKLYLQPHVYLYNLPYHLFKFRADLLEPDNGDHWLDLPLPKLEQDSRYYFMLFRNTQNLVEWRKISAAEYYLLRMIKKGSSAAEACTWLEKQRKSLLNDATEHLHSWFQEWTLQGLLTLQPPPKKRCCLPPDLQHYL